jgi:hypothetical protein
MAKAGDKISSRIAKQASVLTREIHAADTTKGTAALLHVHFVTLNALLGMVGELADEVDRLAGEIDSLKGHSEPPVR